VENTELAKLVLKQIDAFPESFHMGVWGEVMYGLYKGVPRCGTVACLAGHTLLLSGYRLLTEREQMDFLNETGEHPGLFMRPDGTIVQGHYAGEAAQLLGMTHEERYTPGGGVLDDILMDMHCGLERFTVLAGQ